MPLYEEVLRTWRLFLCFVSYVEISFHDVKKDCFEKSTGSIVVKLSIALCESRG